MRRPGVGVVVRGPGSGGDLQTDDGLAAQRDQRNLGSTALGVAVSMVRRGGAATLHRPAWRSHPMMVGPMMVGLMRAGPVMAMMAGGRPARLGGVMMPARIEVVGVGVIAASIMIGHGGRSREAHYQSHQRAQHYGVAHGERSPSFVFGRPLEFPEPQYRAPPMDIERCFPWPARPFIVSPHSAGRDRQTTTPPVGGVVLVTAQAHGRWRVSQGGGASQAR